MSFPKLTLFWAYALVSSCLEWFYKSHGDQAVQLAKDSYLVAIGWIAPYHYVGTTGSNILVYNSKLHVCSRAPSDFAFGG